MCRRLAAAMVAVAMLLAMKYQPARQYSRFVRLCARENARALESLPPGVARTSRAGDTGALLHSSIASVAIQPWAFSSVVLTASGLTTSPSIDESESRGDFAKRVKFRRHRRSYLAEDKVPLVVASVT